MNKAELKNIIKGIILEEMSSDFNSEWGKTPQEVLFYVLSTLEREVEWPLTDVMDSKEVKNLLDPVYHAINVKLKDLDEYQVYNENVIKRPSIKEGDRLTDDERRKIGREKIAALRSKMDQIIDKKIQPDYLDTTDPQARLYYSRELKKIPSDISKMRKKYFKLESKNEPYADSVMRALKAANKAKNAEAVVYYNDCLYNNSACASFERFKGSAAYDSWVSRHDIVDKIEKVKAEYKRFSWRESSENPPTFSCD